MFAMSASGEFRRFNIFPTPGDLNGNRDQLLKKNKVEGSYKDADEYLDVHVRLLREDFLDPWRQTLKEVRSRNGVGHQARYVDKVEVFGVRVIQEPRSRKRPRNDFNNRVQIKFDPAHLAELRRSERKRFQHGSLVCMSTSADNFKTIVVATTIGNLDFSDILSLSFESKSRVKDELRFDCCYELIENTGVCFETYKHFIKVLQKLDTLPFQRYLLDPKRQEIPAPKYLLTKEEGQPVQFNFSSLLKSELISQHQIPVRDKLTAPVLQLDLWPGLDKLDLDKSQYDALKTAVTREFAVIQGPPGTGKTFIGVKIVRLLLENNGVLGEPSRSDDDDDDGQSNVRTLFAGPIILLSHTNHALDQFLEAIIEIYPKETYEATRSIFRIGGRSKSTNEALQRCILNTIDDRSVMKLKNAKIIAMTTSGAAKHHDFINSLQSKVVIVEEAGEILESHLVASLPKTCEHLILIGDHQQLRPRPASHWLETEYALGVSLFERLVRNNMHSVCLTNQRRMRPEIAELMRKHFYASLQNHESVDEYEDVAGIFGNLLFIDHCEEEGARDDNRSYSNDHEARLLVKLCEYLLGVGYMSSQITILVTYAGQERKIRSLSKEKMQEVRISTVDKYQGEENDIILLSLVRSNERNRIGFLNCENRVCVALSRARKGLYIIGNGDLLRSTSELWEKILESLESQNGVITSIRLGCYRHPEKVFYVAHAGDFKDVPNTGCSETCGLKLSRCGHKCKGKCHQLQPDHDEYRCKEKCTKMCSNDLHPCRKRCYKDCFCEEPVHEILPSCGHKEAVPCNIKGHVIDHRCSICHPVYNDLYLRGSIGRYQDKRWNQETSTNNRNTDRQGSSEINDRLKRDRRDRRREERSPFGGQLRKRSHRQREHSDSEPDSDWSPHDKRKRWGRHSRM